MFTTKITCFWDAIRAIQNCKIHLSLNFPFNSYDEKLINPALMENFNPRRNAKSSLQNSISAPSINTFEKKEVHFLENKSERTQIDSYITLFFTKLCKFIIYPFIVWLKFKLHYLVDLLPFFHWFFFFFCPPLRWRIKVHSQLNKRLIALFFFFFSPL